MNYINVTEEAGHRFFAKPLKGPITMLNLLKFRIEADYTLFPNLAPDQPITGQKAYHIYMKCTLPLLEKAGGALIFKGKPDHYLIGPTDEKYDLALLVRHSSAENFHEFVKDPEYLAIVGHRTAALLDSRLLPLME